VIGSTECVGVRVEIGSGIVIATEISLFSSSLSIASGFDEGPAEDGAGREGEHMGELIPAGEVLLDVPELGPTGLRDGILLPL
jgi:hypothetical protein